MFTYNIDEKTKLKMLDLRGAEQLFDLIIQSKDTLREWLPFVD